MLETRSRASSRLGKNRALPSAQTLRAAGDILHFSLASHSNLSVLLSYSEITHWEFSHPSSFKNISALILPCSYFSSQYVLYLISEEEETFLSNSCHLS